MASINTVSLTGVLSEPPAPWDVNPDLPGANLYININKRVKRDGEWTDESFNIAVGVPGKQGEACVERLREGSRVGVVGQLTRDGEYSVQAQMVDFMLGEPVAA